MSWEERSIDSITEIVTKGTTPTTYGYNFIKEGVNYIRAEAISKGGRIKEDTFLKISFDCHEKLKRSQLKSDDILFSIAGMALGKTGIVKENYLPANTNQAVAIIRPIKELINPRFLQFQFINPNFYELVNKFSAQAAQPNINLTQLKSLSILTPPLQTQKRIADILSAYDDLIENNLKRIKLLEQAAQNIYKEWFVNLRFPGHENAVINEDTGLPKGWEKTKLGELVSLQQGFALNKKSRHHISEEVTKYPLLKISDLFKGIESLFVKDTIPKQFLVDKHEIIFSRTGQVGHAFMGRKGVVYNNCFRVKPNDKIDSLFLYQILIEPQFVSYVKGLATGAAQPDLNHGAFKSIEIVLPTRELQDKFSILKESNQTLKFNLIEQNTKLKAARDILLPRLMNRTIEV
jgi:type I restriction enzyme S subunit